MSKAIKIVHKKEDRIKVYFPHNRVYSLAKGFDGATIAGQPFPNKSP